MQHDNGNAYVEFWRQFKAGDARALEDASPRVDLLDAMSEDERAQAAMHLLARLRREPRGDRRVVHALGYLKASAAATLIEDLARDRTPLGVDALLALWRMDGRDERVAALIAALKPTVAGRLRRWLVGADERRVAAAVALGSVDTPESRAALVEAARDPDTAVRFNARVALRRLRGEGTAQAAVAEAEDLM